MHGSTLLRALATIAPMLVGSTAHAQVTSGDFNGDGRSDLAIGIRLEDVDGIVDAGAVQIIYGNPAGLVAQDNQFWTQNTLNVPGDCATNDHFGTALAAGDFDNDGFDDLAIGVPNESINLVLSAGAINVLYGSAQGLQTAGAELLHRSSPGINGITEAFVHFGASLVASDFNDDGFADVVVGAPDDIVSSHAGAGSIHVLQGGSIGLSGFNDLIFTQDSGGIADSAQNNDKFGASLAAGDFDDDGFADVAIGVPNEGLQGAARAGVVHVLYGSAVSLQAAQSQLWHENSSGILGVAEAQDKFGSSVAAGDFDGDGNDDLAIGTHGETVGGVASAGLVHILYGSSTGVNASDDQMWHQATATIGQVADASSNFGRALAAADFDDDGFEDLAIGTPGGSVSGDADAGAVFLLYGSANGLRGNGHQRWDQDLAANGTPAEAGAQFGETIGAGDFNNDGIADLAIGLPLHDANAVTDAGAITVLYGAQPKLSAIGSQFWHQDQTGIVDTCETGDSFCGPAVD